MNNFFKWAAIKATAKFFVYYMVCTVIMTVAFLAIAWDLSLHLEQSIDISWFSDDGLIDFFSKTGHIASDVIPFAQLFDIMFDGFFDQVLGGQAGIIATLVGFAEDFELSDLALSWKEYAPRLMRDLTVLAVANLLYLIYTCSKKKVRALFSDSKSIFFRLMLACTIVIWICASYFAADGIVFYLEQVVVPNKIGALHLTLFLIAIGIQGTSLAYAKKQMVIKLLLYATLKIGFDAVRSLFAWLWIGTIGPAFSTFQLNLIERFFIVNLVVTIIFILLDMAETYTLKQYNPDHE